MSAKLKQIVLLILLLVLGALMWQRFSVLPINSYSPHFGVADQFYSIFPDHSVPESAWYDKEQALYQKQFKGKKFDILLVPAQVQHKAIDQIGRSLISAYLADAISQRSDSQVPSPYQVARALGSYKRQYEPDDVYQLANEMGVNAIVWTYLGHQANLKLDIRLFVQTRDANHRIDAQTPRNEHNWNGIDFSDQQLPSQVFISHIDDILAQLPLKNLGKRLPASVIKGTKGLPYSPAALVKDTTHSALDTAEYYQWLGVLTPKTAERQRQMFFEKSLVVLRDIPSGCDRCRILKARAYSYLHRRPAALAVLGNLDTPEAKSVLALLNGNMGALAEYVAQSAVSLARNLAIIALTDMETEYGKPLKIRGSLLGDVHQKWRFLFERRLSENDAWFSQPNLEFISLLENDFKPDFTPPSDEFPIWRIFLDSILPGDYLFEQYERKMRNIDVVIHQEFGKHLENRLEALCCTNADFSITELDYLLLLDSIFIDNALHMPKLRVEVHALYQEGLDEIEAIQDTYGGHPTLEFLRADAYRDLNKETMHMEDKSLRENSIVGFWNTMYLYQGQDRNAHTAASSLWYFNEKKAYELFSADFPRRYYWWTNSLLRDRNYQQNNPYQNKLIKVKETNLDYTQTQFATLKAVYERHRNEAEGAAGKARAEKILSDNKHRFIGRPERTHFMADLALANGQLDEAKELYKESIENNPDIWDSYGRLAQGYMRGGQYAEALALVQTYPLLDDRQNMAVDISTNLSTLGHQFFWRGKTNEAEQIYLLAVAGTTGSNSEMSAYVKMAILEADLEQAAIAADRKISRYDSPAGYGEYILVQNALGNHDQADQYFRIALKQSTDLRLWHGVLVGQRKRGFTREQLVQWLREEHRAQDDPYILAKYAVMALLVDRSVDPEADKLVGRIEGKTTIEVDVRENKFKRILGNTHHVVGPGKYSQNDEVRLTDKTEIYSDLVLFTRGYTQIRQKNYLEAFRTFEQYARIYYLLDEQSRHALPYMAWSAKKSHQTKPMEVFLGANKNRTWGFEFFLAKAVLLADNENVEASIKLIEKSVDAEVLFNYQSPFDPWYQLVEICEWLYEDIGDERYKALALKYAKQFQTIRPMYAWPYAVEAKLTDSTEDRIRALAFADNLDRYSQRISGFSEQARDDAKSWLKDNSVFIK